MSEFTLNGTLGYQVQSAGFSLSAELVPWDSEICGFPVMQVGNMEVRDRALADADLRQFEQWLIARRVGMVSCRLAENRLVESMLLEGIGFRFIEMVLHPFMDLTKPVYSSDSVNIAIATEKDLPELEQIALTAFHNERFHVDPRLGPLLGNKRYALWVHNVNQHPRQQLLRISEGGRTMGLFVTETSDEMVCNWMLTALAPDFQGRGLGKRVWKAMLAKYAAEGIRRVYTTIGARNNRVLGLYGTLGFRFSSPEMTFHWLRK